MKIRSTTPSRPLRALGPLLRGAAALIAAFALGRGAPADDFRVENKVYAGTDKEPVAESTTMFYDGVVYDFLKRPAEITVFDKAHRRFLLLDTARKLKTELSMDEVSALNANLKTWAAAHKDAQLRALADPKFQVEAGPETSLLKFRSDWVNYQVKTADAGSQEIAGQYREFSDWYAMLNTRLTPGGRLPFPRMAVNAALAERHLLPVEVQLSMKPKKFLAMQKVNMRSEHELFRTLVESDRDRVKQAGEYLAMFQRLEFEEYQKKVGGGE